MHFLSVFSMQSFVDYSHLLYYYSATGRQTEKQADSLAFVMMSGWLSCSDKTELLITAQSLSIIVVSAY